MHTRETRSFAISSFEGSACSLVSNDQLEVGLLSQWDDVPYPPDYRTALAFSSILCPPLRQCSLRTHLPPTRAAKRWV
jgi:hypothetical protein